MKWLVTALCTALLLPVPAVAQEEEAEEEAMGLAGLLSAGNKADLPPITISAGAALTAAPWVLKSGTYYEVEIEGDGSQELALVAPEFFRAIWIDEIVVEGLEIRPLGLDSVEFDEAGTMEIGFIAIKPGRYVMRVPGSTGDSQKLEITIE